MRSADKKKAPPESARRDTQQRERLVILNAGTVYHKSQGKDNHHRGDHRCSDHGMAGYLTDSAGGELET